MKNLWAAALLFAVSACGGDDSSKVVNDTLGTLPEAPTAEVTIDPVIEPIEGLSAPLSMPVALAQDLQATPMSVASQAACEGKLCWPSTQPSEVGSPRRPRVVLSVLMDDADYYDFGYYSPDVLTPNFDQVANSGVRLSRYYAASPACSPTRAALLTGQDPMRYPVQHVWTSQQLRWASGWKGLPVADATVAQKMRELGYSTYHIGKWHIGTARDEFMPDAKGFDNYMLTSEVYEGAARHRTDRGVGDYNLEWRPRWEASRIIERIDAQIAAGKDVFINWWPREPHWAPLSTGMGLYVPPTFDADAFARDNGGVPLDTSTERGKLIATMYAFDSEFGRVMAYLNRKGLAQDTLTLVHSDNGGWRNALPPQRVLSGFKGNLGEGGIRVPFTASWPARIAPGTHTDVPVQSEDYYPTLLSLVGGSVPADLEGEDMSQALLNGVDRKSPLFFQFREGQWRKHEDDREGDLVALVRGCWKILGSNGRYRLYQICRDPGETEDLAATYPDFAAFFARLAKIQRREVSTYFSMKRFTGRRVLAHNARLDVHNEDFSIYMDVGPHQIASGNPLYLYRRGDGLKLTLSGGMLRADILGVAAESRTLTTKTVSLSAPVPADGRSHRLGFVIHGYLDGGSTISLFVDGALAARIQAPINSRGVAGDSVLAVVPEKAKSVIGDLGLILRNVIILTNALEPNEL